LGVLHKNLQNRNGVGNHEKQTPKVGKPWAITNKYIQG
jgi:hypothetical protein